MRDQLNALGKAQGYADTNKNEFADLPNPQRAQEIVAEARKRLAASGGKPSQLNVMISRVTDEFAQRDAQDRTSGNSSGADYVQPNNMENYIDKVLGMAGMTGETANVPIPGDRPPNPNEVEAGNNETAYNDSKLDLPEEGAGDALSGPEEDGEGTSFGTIAATLLAGGGTVALAKYLYGKFANQSGDAVDASNPVDKSIAAIEGQDGNTSPSQQMISEDKTARLPAPDQEMYVGRVNPDGTMGTDTVPKSGIDASIDSTMSEDQIDQVFQDRVEGRTGDGTRPAPNRFATQAQPDPNVAAAIDQATEMANSGDIRGAVTTLREAGVELDDSLMRMLAESSNTFKGLRQRVGSGAVKSAVRGAAR